MMTAYDVKNFAYFRGRDLTYSFDPLTGVLTREEVSEYVKYLLKQQQPFSFGIADIDNFKSVNDSFGHMAGDKVLAATAEYICGKVGSSGVVGRFGGDEFIIVLEGICDYKEVWNLGHDINMNIGGLEFEGLKGLAITLTMGITRSPADGKTFDGLLALADKALYRGKMKGRNCFIIYLPEKYRGLEMTEVGEKKFTSPHLCSRVFRYLTATDEIEDGIELLFKQFSAYFMVDHICVETGRGMNFQVVHRLAKNKHFRHIDYSDISAYFNNIGLAYFNKVEDMKEEDYTSLLKDLRDQHISSALYCKIGAFGREYGFIRVDMTDTVRIWQQNEKELIVVMANAMGLLLHYQGKTLEDMPVRAPFFAGEEG